jgi:large subunit ribosomal protein L3
MPVILGKKIGMTSLFTEAGVRYPATVIEAGPCPVTMKRTSDRDGYTAIQIGYSPLADRHVNKPQRGFFDKSGIAPTKYLKEFRTEPTTELNVGEILTVEQFKKGDLIKVSGKSKGHGFQGVVKRHHFAGVGMATHGQSDRQRHPGSIGSSSYPSRVLKGLRMGGRMGGKRITVRNLEVLEVMVEQNLLIIKGSVPGAPNTILEIVKQ